MTQHYRRQDYVSPDTLDQVHQCLEHLGRESVARLALLTDPTGQQLTWYGDLDQRLADAISALSAGQMGASRELVQALRISSTFSMMIREGQDYNYYLTAPAERYILLLVVPTHTPLGWVRHLLREQHDGIGRLLERLEIESRRALAQTAFTPEGVGALLEGMDEVWAFPEAGHEVLAVA